MRLNLNEMYVSAKTTIKSTEQNALVRVTMLRHLEYRSGAESNGRKNKFKLNQNIAPIKKTQKYANSCENIG